MRILHISSARTFGGGERHVADLCRGLADLGHDVFVALRPTNEWQHRLSFLPPENIAHVSIRNSFGVISSMRIAEFVRQNGIEIVHAHVARDYIPASIACLASKPAKFVLTRHVMFPLKPFNRFALKNLSKAIGVSAPVGEGLRAVFPRDKIAVINNGLDVNALSDDERTKLRREFREFHGIPQDVPLVGTLGELREMKGQRDFVLAANEISKEFPAVHFVVVGRDNSADRSFRRELRRMVGIFGMEDRFLWLDWIDDTDSFFSAIDIFVSPSHSESFGLAMLEAMAHGKPVVATKTDGARELFGDSADLVKINDPVALAHKIGELLGEEAVCANCGAHNRRTAGEKFSLKRMIHETEALYRKILS
jgi:glycosyltransferase involved in cell wall biosynthesis